MPHDERRFVREVYGALEKTAKQIKISKGKTIAKVRFFFHRMVRNGINQSTAESPASLEQPCRKVKVIHLLQFYFGEQLI